MDRTAELTPERVGEYLGRLSSDRARAMAISSLVAVGHNITEERVLWALDLLANEKDYLGAARLAERAGMAESSLGYLEKTIEVDRQKGLETAFETARLRDAGRVAENAGMAERAIGYYRKAGKPQDLLKVAQISEQNGLTSDAIVMYVGLGRYESAAAAAAASESAAQIIEGLAVDGNLLLPMARVAKRAGLEDKAQALFGRAVSHLLAGGKHDEGAKLAEECGMHETAAEVYRGRMEYFEGRGEPEQAGEYALKAGMEDKAKGLFRKAYEKLRAGHAGIRFEGTNYEAFGRLADSAYRAGLADVALSLYEDAARFSKGQTGWLERAMKIAGETGQNDRAVQLVLDTMGEGPAAQKAEDLGLYDRAMQLYEQSGNFDGAERAAVAAGDGARVEAYRAFLKHTR